MLILTWNQIQVVNIQMEKILPAVPGSLGRFMQYINAVIQYFYHSFSSCTSCVNFLPM